MKTHLLSVKEQQKTTKDVENFIFGAYAWLFTNFSLKVALRCNSVHTVLTFLIK
jgi:hypothetical protein